MKLRNQLLALFCILLFLGFGYLYFHKWVEQKPFGIISFVSDDLTTSDITAARLYNGGADSRLTLENLPNVAILSNYANDYAVPDSASAASALATGVKGNKLRISMDSKGKAIASILELARSKGRASGLITNGKPHRSRRGGLLRLACRQCGRCPGPRAAVGAIGRQPKNRRRNGRRRGSAFTPEYKGRTAQRRARPASSSFATRAAS